MRRRTWVAAPGALILLADVYKRQMLYNEKETISQRRRTRWKRPGEEKRSRFGQDR